MRDYSTELQHTPCGPLLQFFTGVTGTNRTKEARRSGPLGKARLPFSLLVTLAVLFVVMLFFGPIAEGRHEADVERLLGL